MSNPPYGPGQGAPGNGPEDDWFRPAPQAREEIYRESEYGNGAPQFAPQEPSYGGYAQNDHTAYDNGYDPRGQGGQGGQGGQPYDDFYASPDGQGYAATTMNGAVGYDDPDQTRLDGTPIRDEIPGADGEEPEDKGWKKYIPNWKIVAGVCALGLVASITLVGVGYATTPAPDLSPGNAQDGVLDQGSHVYWASPEKNKKPIFRIGQPRENVQYEDIPLHVRQAVMAAEQQTFETDPGVSPRGLMRAVYNTATGGQVQGGSTITQQLARNYLNSLSKDRSIGRKFKEIFTAVKMEGKYSKEVILEKYLNTIHFGRQSDGIQAASRAYFHKNVQDLNVEQGALLAAVIQQPYNFCANCDKNSNGYRGLLFRWNYVLNNMVEEGWIEKADRDKMQFPETKEDFTWTSDGGQVSYIRDRIDRELQSIPGLDYESVSTSGYRIYTSLNKKLMKYAKEAVEEAGPQGQGPLIRSGLAVVDPKSGKIVAFYGGNPKKGGENGQSDAALVEMPQIGSSFKPYVLATALSKNININSLIEGRGLICMNKTTGDVIEELRNEDSCKADPNGYWMRSTHDLGPSITLNKATEQSINSSFVRLALKVGLPDVINMAKSFGIPESALEEMDGRASLALGTINVSAVNQAAGYAAFANGGTSVTPHLITKITKMVDGNEVKVVDLPWDKGNKRILTEDQAAQATVAMRTVVTQGTGTKARLISQPAAGKTGTTDEAAATWFVGYTPQYSAAVTVFHQNSKSMGDVYGGNYPALIWKAFMDKALAGKEVVNFPDTTYSGEKTIYDTPKPKPTKEKEECSRLQQMLRQCGDDHEQPQPGHPQDLPGCTEGNLLNCDPQKPPPGTEGAPPGWWCAVHADYPACQNQPDPNQPVDNDGDGIPADQDPNDNDPNWPNPQHP